MENHNDEIRPLHIGDTAIDIFGRPGIVADIYYRGVDSNGHYYVAFRTTNGHRGIRYGE